MLNCLNYLVLGVRSKKTMAPKVCVPADFGKQHIGAPSHGNLTFTLQEGVKIKANSIILSLNSPVIDELTTNLHQTSLEADDFSREAVDCFIEAAYTGEVEALNRENFRDVNKMSAVFKVNWLADRCEQYFESYLRALDSESSYTEILFAVEEAVFLMSALKSRTFLNMVVQKMSGFNGRDPFIFGYLSNLSAATFLQIDACVAIVNADIHVLVELLLTYLEEKDIFSFDEKSRYLFEILDLDLCYMKSPKTHEKLFSVLKSMENLKSEDYKLILGKLEQISSQNVVSYWSVVAMKPFGPYLQSSLNSMINTLVADKTVDNMYKLVDGIWLRLRECHDDTEFLIEDLWEIKDMYGWEKIDYEYVNRLFVHSASAECKCFVERLRNCSSLVSKRHDKFYASSSSEYSSPNAFIREIFDKDNEILFHVENPEYSDISFILSSTPMKGNDPNTFSLKWGALSRRPNFVVPKVHFALERWKDDQWSIIPITWCSKPVCESTRRVWHWGPIWFGNIGENVFHKLIKGDEKLVNWKPSIGSFEECKYRFVLFIVGLKKEA